MSALENLPQECLVVIESCWTDRPNNLSDFLDVNEAETFTAHTITDGENGCVVFDPCIFSEPEFCKRLCPHGQIPKPRAYIRPVHGASPIATYRVCYRGGRGYANGIRTVRERSDGWFVISGAHIRPRIDVYDVIINL